MKSKTSELTGAALDCAVAIAEGWTVTKAEDNSREYVWLMKVGSNQDLRSYRPSSNWMQGGPIIERENIGLGKFNNQDWFAFIGDGAEYSGTTPLIAVMRCYVASKLGEEIDVPEELL